MTPADRERALSVIRENIARDGYHLYVVSGEMHPRFAYTIGLSPKIGKELILAGAVLYMYEEVVQIIEQTVPKLIADPASEQSAHRLDLYGSFEFRQVDPSWAATLMLGALDFYQKPEIAALQIVPDKAHWTVDVPDMTAPWSRDTSSAWRWLKESWPYPVPRSSHAMTDLDALRGASVMEACRWEDDLGAFCSRRLRDTERADTTGAAGDSLGCRPISYANTRTPGGRGYLAKRTR